MLVELEFLDIDAIHAAKVDGVAAISSGDNGKSTARAETVFNQLLVEGVLAELFERAGRELEAVFGDVTGEGRW